MSELPRQFRQQAYEIYDYRIDMVANELRSYCESPIEVAFGTAFMLLGDYHYGQVALHEPGYDGEVNALEFETVLKCQQKIGRHRVDFVAHWTYPEYQQKIIIECDGHNFHERTKEQAQRDRAKDRDWQNAGYRVFRFTGSEIYRDAFKCATEVFEALGMIADEVRQGK
jgi:very-short-patch-repair endonuclease